MELIDSRTETVGRIPVRRALPRRGRRTIGAWCFADHMGPVAVTEQHGLDIGPHPHIGLQTVTWLVEGRALHRDSLGSEQLISPGQLNLMTAGHGVAHSEEATDTYRGRLHGIQLWIAQPDATRDGPAAFEHHGELPRLELTGATATVLVGELDGHRSPARHDTPLVGADLQLRAPTDLPLRPGFEYGVVVLDGTVTVDGTDLGTGRLGYLGAGRTTLGILPRGPARAVLIGGEPFGEELVMWWNYVGRSRAEIDDAHRSWSTGDGRFPTVASPLAPVHVGPPHWQVPGAAH